MVLHSSPKRKRNEKLEIDEYSLINLPQTSNKIESIINQNNIENELPVFELIPIDDDTSSTNSKEIFTIDEVFIFN